jgi:hypothetical protein
VSAATHGAACGVVIGVAMILLLQQLSLLDLSALVPSLIDLLVGALLGAVVFGLMGWAIGRRARPVSV